MKLQKVSIRKRILLASLIFSYVVGIAFGSFVHNLFHHISDQHHHSLPCLVTGLTEIPSDEPQAFSQEATITSNVCAFKLALDSLSRPTISGHAQIKIKILAHKEIPHFSKPSFIWIKKVLISSISARGPPARA